MNRSSHLPRILYVSEGWTHGAQVRCLNILRALQQIGTVEVVLLRSANTNADAIVEVGREAKIAYTLQNERRPTNSIIAKVKSTFDPRSHYPINLGVDEVGTQRLLRSQKEYDLVWFFKQRSADLFPNMSWSRSVVDIDDVQSTYERTAVRTGGPLCRLKALRSQFMWQRRERLLGERFNTLTVCSEQDRAYLRSSGVNANIHVIPNGFETPLVEPVHKPTAPPRIGFIGGFDHLPNREGVAWFVNKVWPRIKGGVPEARLRLIGRDSDKYGGLDGPDVNRLGPLVNPSEEISTWSAMVVPIRLGAGTRVKIAQGFSQKCPIVSTSLGAFGYGAVDGREMYLADSASAFASACIRTIREPGEATQLAQRAWNIFVDKWSWDAIRPLVWAAAEDGLRSSVPLPLHEDQPV